MNYIVILPLLLPFHAVNMHYKVSINGQDIPREPQMRTVLDCYRYALIEGFANPWNIAIIAAHWLVPLVLMYVIWTLIVRRRNTMEWEDSQTCKEVADAVSDLLDP